VESREEDAAARATAAAQQEQEMQAQQQGLDALAEKLAQQEADLKVCAQAARGGKAGSPL
jgi:hypothetical protein